MTPRRGVGGWVRLYRAAIALYPPSFRRRFGERMVQDVAELLESDGARGRSRLSTLGRVAGDLVRSLPGEWVRVAPGSRAGGGWGRDAALAARRLARAPGFVASVVGTLTVGLGAFAVVYTAVDRVLLAPLPYAEPDDLYYVWRDYSAVFPLERGWLSGPDVAALDSVGGSIRGAAALQRATATLGGSLDGEPWQIRVLNVSPNLFDLLGVAPALGRGFAPDEAGEGRPPLLVVGHDLWLRAFGGDPSVVGREVRLNGNPFTVIGVMGPDFRFAVHTSLGSPEGTDAYVTFPVDLAAQSPGAGSYAGVIRARSGTPAERVAAEVEALGFALDERDHGGQGIRLYPVGMKADLVAPVRPAMVVLGLSGAFLLLVLTVNLATLLLTRAAQREREFAVARALGANQVAVVRGMLLEGGILGLLGGAAAALAAVWGTGALVAMAPLDLVRREAIAVDLRIGVTILGTGLLLGLLAGMLPATWAARTRLESLMGSTAVRGGGGHGRLRSGMVVVQVALSLVLLSAGGLVARSFESLLRSDPGFEPGGVLTFRIVAPAALYPDQAAVNEVYGRLRAELAALPGVSSAAAANALPMLAIASQRPVHMPGAPGNTGEQEVDQPMVDWMIALAGYFETLGIPVLAGRAFEGTPPAGVREVVIDRLLAERYFPGADPVGRILQFSSADSLTIVGVVEHARLYDVHVDGRPQIYVRSDDFLARLVFFAVRTGRDPMALATDVRAVARRVAPDLALAEVRTMDQVVGDALRQQRLSAVLIGGFSLGALLLASMGLFGVVSGAVVRRRHEIAVRLALGAEPRRAVRLVLLDGARLVALGLLLGAPGIWLSAEVLRGVLVGVSPYDPVTLAAVASGLAAVALVACWLPARRVARIDPAGSLRRE